MSHRLLKITSNGELDLPVTLISVRKSALYCFAFVAVLTACGRDSDQPREFSTSGPVMGTQYHLTIVLKEPITNGDQLPVITSVFDAVNAQFSTYQKDSDISKFNQSTSTEWFESSFEFCSGLQEALAISALTAGAFDPTVGRLVNLWGFGPDGIRSQAPTDSEVDTALRTTGFHHLHTQCDRNEIRKDRVGLFVDLSGYAKGLAVDRAAETLDENHITDYLVELGGEIRVRGKNAKQQPWRIAIEKPTDDERTAQNVLRVTNVAVATSGDYRNFFSHDGNRYSHAIDPETGKPVAHQTASVSVVAERAAYADAMATALLVMGHKKGFEFAESHQIAAYFLVRGKNELDAIATTAFAPYVEEH